MSYSGSVGGVCGSVVVVVSVSLTGTFEIQFTMPTVPAVVTSSITIVAITILLVSQSEIVSLKADPPQYSVSHWSLNCHALIHERGQSLILMCASEHITRTELTENRHYLFAYI